ncbi:MAG: signal transduction histidine kinase [Myxococcota bacterium]
MNLRSFRGRVLLGSVLTAVLALVLVWASIGLVVSSAGGRGRGPGPEMARVLVEACEAAPDEWRRVRVGRTHVRFIPADDPLQEVPGLVRSLPVGEQLHNPDDPRFRWWHVSETGPCAWAAVASGPPPRIHIASQIGLAVGVFLAILGAGFGSYWLTIRPLLGRIEGLRTAATRLGTEEYIPAEDDVNDALSAIGNVLDSSHMRIVEDRAELLSRHRALENHLAEIAHDLRTPLGSLLLALGEVDVAHPDSPAAARAIGDAAYVTALVDNLHQAARLRHGLDPSLGECDLLDVVRRIELRFRALGGAKGVDVAASIPEGELWVECETALLERAVGNLVHNATIHGGDHVAVLVDVMGDSFVLTVLDDGPGMSVDAIADLELATFRSDPARRRSSGLGLAITDEIVRRLDWTLQLDRGPDGGLRARISGRFLRT